MSIHESIYDPIAPPVSLPPAHLLLAAHEEPALLTGQRLQIRAFNHRAGELLGLSPAHLGRPVPEVLRKCGACETRTIDALVETAAVSDSESFLPIKLLVGGRPIAGTWSVLPIGYGETDAFWLHRFYVEQSDHVDPARVDFLANVSHELRTPLSALVATTELMLQDYQTLPAVELGTMINLLHRNTRRLEALVSNLLDAAALQNGKLHLRLSSTSVESLLRDASDFVLPLLNSKNQKLETRLGGTLPVLALDARRLVGVLVNLLSNASRYGLPNEPIRLAVNVERDLVRFSVSQKGPGIPRHEQVQLFQRFYRGTTGEKVSGGSGLGLAIVKEIVEMHGGTVGLVSNPGKTTTFWFTIPLGGDQA